MRELPRGHERGHREQSTTTPHAMAGVSQTQDFTPMTAVVSSSEFQPFQDRNKQRAVIRIGSPRVILFMLRIDLSASVFFYD